MTSTSPKTIYRSKEIDSELANKIEMLGEYNEQLSYLKGKTDKIKSEIKESLDNMKDSSDQKVEVETDTYKITLGKDSVSKTVDLQKMKKEEPQLYKSLLSRFPKEIKRSGRLSISMTNEGE